MAVGVLVAATVGNAAEANADPVYRFVRGDINSDGAVNLADSIFLLNFLFQGGPGPTCEKAADTNQDDAVNLTDAVYLLNHLFQGGPIPPAPNVETGPGVDLGPLGCVTDDLVVVEPRSHAGGDLAMGDGFSCAIVTDEPPGVAEAAVGPVACWGANGVGQLGVGDLFGRAEPTRLADDFRARQVVAGRAFACALIDDGDDAGGIRCWGEGADGAIGFGAANDRVSPFQPVFGFDASTPALDIAAGARHVCAIRQTAGGNQLWCWGSGPSGQLGFPSQGPTLPGLVDLGGLNPVDVTAGDEHTCVAMDDGGVYCFGGNEWAQLDTDSAGGPGLRRIDRLDFELGEPVLLDAGAFHTCAIGRAGVRECWGDFLGDTEDLVFGMANGGGEFEAHACFTDIDGRIECDAHTEWASYDATTLPAGPRTLALGASHGCAVYDAPVICPGDGNEATLCCFGTNVDGELGNEARPQPSHEGVAVVLPGL